MPPSTKPPASVATPTPIVVHFPAGAIHVALKGNLAPHTRRTYQLTILGGQYTVLHLITADMLHLIFHGADGTVLISPMGDVRSWWGSIPSTQDYFLSVESGDAGGHYRLVVTIYPPGQSRTTFYHSPGEQGFALELPPDFEEQPYPYDGISPDADLGTIVGSFYLSNPTFYDNTNLSEAYLVVRQGTPAQCASYAPPLGNPLEDFPTFYDLTFHGMQAEEGAAGNLYTTTSHYLVYQGTCYSINTLVHSTNIGNYPPGSITPYDEEGLQALFETVLASFRMVPQTP